MEIDVEVGKLTTRKDPRRMYVTVMASEGRTEVTVASEVHRRFPVQRQRPGYAKDWIQDKAEVEDLSQVVQH